MYLEEKVNAITVDPEKNIPLIVWMLENPKSPLALPGKISLYNHDCLHVLLNQDFSLGGEAFVVGFRMGNSPDTKVFHLKIFKFVSRFLYPKKFKFRGSDFLDFAAGFEYGRSLDNKRINEVDFKRICNVNINDIRKHYGIEILKLKQIKERVVLNQGLIYSGKKKSVAQRLILSSIICAVSGGFLLALNIDISGFGFIFLALSSSQMLVSSIIQEDRIMVLYAASVFIFVDSLGVYRWLLS